MTSTYSSAARLRDGRSRSRTPDVAGLRLTPPKGNDPWTYKLDLLRNYSSSQQAGVTGTQVG
jgi:hypothetical protein